MLVDRVLRDLDLPDPEERTGNAIRGSRLGRCARQSAYMLFPGAYPPEPLPARAKLVFAFGTMIHDLVRANFRRVVPGEFGMEEERFHFRVPLTVKQAKAAKALFESNALRGTVQEGSTLRTFNGPLGLRGWSVALTEPHRRGLWLNLAEPALYVPLHVDGIADAGPYGLAPVEIKSMTSAGFRAALSGKVEYSYRVQMAAAIDATALDTQLYIAVRKDTCHLLEVVYSKRIDTVRVTFTKQSLVVKAAELEIDDWEAAQVEHPFEPALVAEARARVVRILLATPTRLPAREHAPSFTCATCEGTGSQANAKTTGLPLKAGPKPCVDCDKVDGAPSGQLAEAELPWQCRYCPYIFHCWKDAEPRLAFDREARPHYWVTRKAVEGMPP